MKSQTVLFIHGMFVTHRCWEGWERLFAERGYRTLAPAWPEHQLPVEEQRRRHPNPELGALTLEAVVARYASIAIDCETPPILIGHSMGGLVVQLLLQLGLGAAGIAIDSAPPKGVLSLRWSFLKSNWPAISPFASIDEPVLLSFEQFCYAFAHTLSPEEQRAAYDQHVVPESRRVGKGPTTDAARIDFSRARSPLLLIAGSDDHIIPASLNRANYRRYAASPAVTDFHEFPGRTHWIIAQRGWEEVAQHALEWIEKAPARAARAA